MSRFIKDAPIAICDRCRTKYLRRELSPDRDKPGLLVCRPCNDIRDPWRQPFFPKDEDIHVDRARPAQALDVPTTMTGVDDTGHVVEVPLDANLVQRPVRDYIAAAAGVSFAVFGSDAVLAVSEMAPSLSFDFTQASLAPTVGAATVALTRAGTATRVNSSGLLEVVGANAPRFDFDPVALTCKGLLVEGSRTNLCLASDRMDNATYWGAGNMALSAAPGIDGSATSAQLATASTTAWAGLSQNFTLATSTQYSFFTYLKKSAAVPSTSFGMYNNTLGWVAGLNLVVNWSVNPPTASVSQGTGTCFIEAAPNGFWKVGGTFTTDSTPVVHSLFRYIRNGGNEVAGDAVVFGPAQIEQASFASSYIPTTTAAVARNADVTISDSISSWINQNEGTFFVEWQARDASGLSVVAAINNAGAYGTGNGMLLRQDAGGASLDFGGNTSGATASGASPTGINKACGSYDRTGAVQAACVNGGAVVENSNLDYTGGGTRLQFGALDSALDQPFNGWMRKFDFYPARVFDARLQQLSQ